MRASSSMGSLDFTGLWSRGPAEFRARYFGKPVPETVEARGSPNNHHELGVKVI